MNAQLFTMKYFLPSTKHVVLEDLSGNYYSRVADPQDFTFGFSDDCDESKLKPLSASDNAAIARIKKAESIHPEPLRVYSVFKNTIIFGHLYQPKLFISIPAADFDQLSDQEIAEIGDMPGNTDLSEPLTAERINNHLIIY